jgi:hypothetical protein
MKVRFALLLGIAVCMRAEASPIDAPVNVVARATTTSQVLVSWSAVAGASSYQVYRSIDGTTYDVVGVSSGVTFNDRWVTADTIYFYRVRTVAPGPILSDYSERAMALTTRFADDPLVPGVTPVKAIHLLQLRTAINRAHTLAGLGEVAFTPPLTAGTTTIVPPHVTDLRDAIDAARNALVLSALNYTNSTITSGTTPILAAHVSELRGGVNGARRNGAICDPGNGTCAGNTGTYCSDDGLSSLQETCAPAQGTFCNTSTGRCDDACALAAASHSPTGCEFYPTVTANVVPSTFHFAIGVKNANASAAGVTITIGGAAVTSLTVAANSAQFVNLPWVSSLKGPEGGGMPGSVFATAGAYRLQSTLPVTVYQYSPLEYVIGLDFSYSNDASVLPPAHAWGTNYLVATQPHLAALSGFYSITALTDYTTVQVRSSAVIKSGSGLPTPAGSVGTLILNAGDVIEAVTSGTAPGDLTGTVIQSNKPVQVIGGHQCSQVPIDTSYCDHIEESIPPVTSLSSDYVVAAPWVSLNQPKVRRVRIIGTSDGTNLTFDPPQTAPTSINAGAFTDIDTTNSFRITATHPVLIAEFMTGNDAGGNAGDPAMTIAPGIDKFKTGFTFLAPANYSSNYVNIVAPTGTSVTVDGTAIPAASFSAIGTSGYVVARAALANTASDHDITASAPVGVSVYGYGDFTSYWYPAVPVQ